MPAALDGPLRAEHRIHTPGDAYRDVARAMRGSTLAVGVTTAAAKLSVCHRIARISAGAAAKREADAEVDRDQVVRIGGAPSA